MKHFISGIVLSVVIGAAPLAIYARAAEISPADDTNRPSIYPAALAVVEVTETEVHCRTCSGLEYAFTHDETDLTPGDLVAVLMDDNGTPDDVTDDAITFVKYAGYGDPATW